MAPPNDPPPHPHEDHTAERTVRIRYLQAVINVYGPWTTSPVINDCERHLARTRVAKARELLADLTDLTEHDRRPSRAWKAADR